MASPWHAFALRFAKELLAGAFKVEPSWGLYNEADGSIGCAVNGDVIFINIRNFSSSDSDPFSIANFASHELAHLLEEPRVIRRT
jgi:hypothetical protein